MPDLSHLEDKALWRLQFRIRGDVRLSDLHLYGEPATFESLTRARGEVYAECKRRWPGWPVFDNAREVAASGRLLDGRTWEEVPHE